MDKFINTIWPYIWSAGLIIAGIYFIWKKEVTVGIEGRAPMFYIKGIYATIIGLVAIISGILLLFKPDAISQLDFGL